MPSAYPKIAVATTSRADYGIYRPLLEALRASGRTIELIVGGTHPVRRFGHTLDEIRADGFGAIHVVEHLAGGDRAVDSAESCGAAVTGFARALDQCRADLMFVLGDRHEMLAAGLAGAILKTPIAHLHGGDVTEGVTDDQFRHALTKLSHVHFPAIEPHGQRLRAMGEEAWRVYVVGSLALDQFAAFVPLALESLARGAGLDPAVPCVVLVFHPETLGAVSPADAFERVAAGMRDFDGNLVLVGSNADEGHVGLSAAVRAWAAARPRTAWIASLSQREYWSWLSHARALVGNSSSGLIEAPTLGLPVVNVGDRQKGRVRAANVIDAPCETAAIAVALRRALSDEFRCGLAGLVNPYGDGRTAARVLSVLDGLPPREQLLRKRWAGLDRL